MWGMSATNYGPIFREGQPISAQQFNEELGKCITDVQIVPGSGLTMSRFGRRVTIGVRIGRSGSIFPAPGEDYQVLMSFGGNWIVEWPLTHGDP